MAHHSLTKTRILLLAPMYLNGSEVLMPDLAESGRDQTAQCFKLQTLFLQMGLSTNTIVVAHECTSGVIVHSAVHVSREERARLRESTHSNIGGRGR